jgi:hypothetical protein
VGDFLKDAKKGCHLAKKIWKSLKTQGKGMVRDEEEIRFVVDTNILIPTLMKDNSLTGRAAIL